MIHPHRPGWRDPRTLEKGTPVDTLRNLEGSHSVFTNTADELQPLIRQRMIWAIAPDSMAEFRTVALGGHAASPEVSAKEKAADVERRRLIFPFIQLLSHFTATAAHVMISSKVEAGILSEPSTEERTNYAREVTATTSAIIANLIDMGVLTYGKGVVK